MTPDEIDRLIYGIDPEFSIPERDAGGMWTAVHLPSQRMIGSYSWERLAFKALNTRLAYRRAQCGEST